VEAEAELWRRLESSQRLQDDYTLLQEYAGALQMCPHTAICVWPHTATDVSACCYMCVASYCYRCVRILLYVCGLILLQMCPHTAICMWSACKLYIIVLILLVA
jgi:hypothetical protein